ncbi:hypothetical protein MAHJHV63_49940 [Mycobacterium avium subsp. hominissuis]
MWGLRTCPVRFSYLPHTLGAVLGAQSTAPAPRAEHRADRGIEEEGNPAQR